MIFFTVKIVCMHSCEKVILIIKVIFKESIYQRKILILNLLFLRYA